MRQSCKHPIPTPSWRRGRQGWEWGSSGDEVHLISYLSVRFSAAKAATPLGEFVGIELRYFIIRLEAMEKKEFIVTENPALSVKIREFT
jgi:hypothetical protein